jgi:hypothetical protein
LARLDIFRSANSNRNNALNTTIPTTTTSSAMSAALGLSDNAASTLLKETRKPSTPSFGDIVIARVDFKHQQWQQQLDSPPPPPSPLALPAIIGRRPEVDSAIGSGGSFIAICTCHSICRSSVSSFALHHTVRAILR